MIDYSNMALEIREFWEREKINKELIQRKGKKFFFLDGPPYANAVPHVGHAKNTVFKDIVIRKKFMEGYAVHFKPGFDTHGLPIENMVEKQMGLGSKKDIVSLGIGKFMAECKKNAALNKDLWMEMYSLLGSLYANTEPYLTYTNEYIQSGWWAFQQMHKKKMMYHGEKPVMWCPHCETSLSGYEVTDSYKEVSDPGIYVLFSLKDDDRKLLVYTTTPWTLPSNVAVALAPKENYATVEVGGKKVILAEKRLAHLSELGFGGQVLETFKGEKLVGKTYLPLLDVPLQRDLAAGKRGKAHIVIASIPLLKERVASKVKSKKNLSGEDLFEEFVTVTEGTGFVHTAPGHGKTDYWVGQHYKLACVSPLNDECHLLPESGFSGFVKKADKEIIARMKNDGTLLHSTQIMHKYPLCWRCKSPLIFRLSEQLFLHIDHLKNSELKPRGSGEFFRPRKFVRAHSGVFAQSERTNFLSVKKIMLKENEKVNWMPPFVEERFANWIENAEDWNISRQRYWGIPIPLWRCSCGEEKVVGSAEELEKLSGQKLEDLHLAESVHFKCEECGKQMQKMKGILDVWFDSGIAPYASFGYPAHNKELFEKQFPADRINEAQDQVRGWFYSLLFCSSAIFGKAPYKAVSMTGWVVGKEGEKLSKSTGNALSAKEAIEKMGADALRYYFCWDSAPYDLQKFNAEVAQKEMGKIFTVLLNLVNLATAEKMSKKLDTEDRWILSRLESQTKAYDSAVETFELNTALRGISDFIVSELSRQYVQMTREKENGAVVAACLKKIVTLLAPIAPFLCEKLWQLMRTKEIVDERSVHLTSWPNAIAKKIDRKLEEEMGSALKAIELGLAERDKAKIGLRWPLSTANVSGIEISDDTLEIIARQLNVKKVEIKEGKELSVVLDTVMTSDLESEGFSRELARKVQAERKNARLEKKDTIKLKVYAPESILSHFRTHCEFLRMRTNSENIKFIDGESPAGAIVFTVREVKIGILFRN